MARSNHALKQWARTSPSGGYLFPRPARYQRQPVRRVYAQPARQQRHTLARLLGKALLLPVLIVVLTITLTAKLIVGCVRGLWRALRPR